MPSKGGEIHNNQGVIAPVGMPLRGVASPSSRVRIGLARMPSAAASRAGYSPSGRTPKENVSAFPRQVWQMH
jgi:hypothetical protein